MKKTIVILAHALAGWAVCGASMGLGLAFFAEPTALAIHAAVAPVAFAIVSWVYFTKFRYTSPFTTAFIFIGVILFLDIFVVSLLIVENFSMFESFTGAWLPMILIFAATWITGTALKGK